MSTIDVKVPDIGDFKDIPVIEVLVKPGDAVKAEDSLVTLESDKATMDVPVAGRGRGEGSEAQGRRQGQRRHAGPDARHAAAAMRSPAQPRQSQRRRPHLRRAARIRLASAPASAAHARSGCRAARPARPRPLRPARPPRLPRRRITSVQGRARVAVGAQVRARARRRSCAKIKGTGPKGRILQEDVQNFVKQALSGAAPAASGGIAGGGVTQPAAVAERRFREVRAGRSQAAVADQEDLRREPRAELGDDPARHAIRRGRHHRARGVSRARSTRRTRKPASRSRCSRS